MRAAVAAALLIAACTAQDGSTPRAALDRRLDAEDFMAAGDVCGAREHAGLIGERYDEAQRAALPPNSRVIRHDMANTLEFTPSRISVILDARGRIVAIGCY